MILVVDRSRPRSESHKIMTTGKKDGKLASNLLRNPNTPKNVKSVAGSDLAGRKGHKPGK